MADSAFELLSQADLLTSESQRLIAAHPAPTVLVQALRQLMHAGILTEQNFRVVVGGQEELASVFCSLEQAGILTTANRSMVADHFDPFHISAALATLAWAEILTQEIFELVCTHLQPNLLARALLFLKQSKLLTQAYFKLVVRHDWPDIFANILQLFKFAGILTKDNTARIISHGELPTLGSALTLLKRAHILTQANLDALLLPEHLSLLSRARRQDWDRVPAKYLNQTNFQELLSAAAEPYPEEAIAHRFDCILGIAAAPSIVELPLTWLRDTTKLQHSYGPTLAPETTIKEMIMALDGLGTGHQLSAAQRCIERLNTTGHRFIDQSGMSLRQLLALSYVVLGDSLAVLVETLYEIQRAGNLSVAGADDGLEDQPLEMVATFGKLYEKLPDMHSDVQTIPAGQVQAMAKLVRLVQQQTLDLLSTLASPTTTTDFLAITDLLGKLEQDHHVAAIWDKIAKKVQSDLWDEFAEVYHSNPSDPRFQALMASGKEVALPDIMTIKCQLQDSPGAQCYAATAALRVAELGLFSEKLPVFDSPASMGSHP